MPGWPSSLAGFSSLWRAMVGHLAQLIQVPAGLMPRPCLMNSGSFLVIHHPGWWV